MKVMQDIYRGVHEGDAGHLQRSTYMEVMQDVYTGVHEGDVRRVQRSA